jgi:hypothetical protein
MLAHMPFPDLTKLQDLIPILVFLLPGFVSTGIVSLMVVRKPQEVFSRVVEAVIFTATNLAVFFIAKAILSRIAVLSVTFKHFLTVDSHRFFTAGNLTMLALYAVGIGLVLRPITSGYSEFFDGQRSLTKARNPLSGWMCLSNNVIATPSCTLKMDVGSLVG